MLKVLKNRFEQGHRTSPYPEEEVQLHERYRGRPILPEDCPPELLTKCAANCPQQAIDPEAKKIDLGRCVFCGLCAHLSKNKAVTFSNNFEMGASRRQDLICTGELPKLAAISKAHFQQLFGRSLQLRQVSAGGCNACEADINVLNTPFFDLARFGIQYVASPRHADGIHLTGPITRNMRRATLATYEAIPSPKVVIASGTCAISGGPFYGSPEIIGDLNQLLPVDLYIPGCPPHPMTTLHALLSFFR